MKATHGQEGCQCEAGRKAPARWRTGGQTAIELAVFGAILIFMLSVIVRSAVSRSQQQHDILRATRLALTLSYRSSEQKDERGFLNNASRNSASVLIVEDRLTAASAKYGAIDRTPNLMQGSGTHSANLFMPIDFGDTEDLPVFDVFVNGKHFDFSIAAFKTIYLDPTLSPSGLNCPPGMCPHFIVGQASPEFCGRCPEREPECVGQLNPRVVFYDCPKFYTIVDNHPKITKWCDDGSSFLGTPCPPSCEDEPVPGCNLSLRQRFDLGRRGNPPVPRELWEKFSWQWYLVLGYEEEDGETAADPSQLSGLPPPDPGAAPVLLQAEGINLEVGKNILVDVDEDLKLEQIVEVTNSNKVITSVKVRDNQDGDVDFTFGGGTNSSEIPPGFTRDVRTYTLVRGSGTTGGTYLKIDEGKLYSGDGKQYIRTASKKDSIDIIERVFKVSNITGRFCTSAGSRSPRANNPVEVCTNLPGKCFTPENIAQTCMDTESKLIFIRSRIEDLHGRKWVTDVSQDPHINIVR